MTRSLTVERQSWPIAGSFRISRGAKTAAEVVVASIAQDGLTGRGECVPYARYGESLDTVERDIKAQELAVSGGLTREGLRETMPPGAARNALDCALWDLEAKQAGVRAWTLAGLNTLEPLTTAYTLSLDTPDAMAAAARKASNRPLLKIKLGSEGDVERLAAVREAAPDARLIVDANEGWSNRNLEAMLDACRHNRVELVEQPLHSDDDALLASVSRTVPVCADESVHGLAGLEQVAERYDAINIKLDKTGGLTEALMVCRTAQDHGLSIMVGCMLATSLAMAPAMIVAQYAGVVDLDGPLLLSGDRVPGITFEGSTMHPPPADLWG